MKIARSAIFKNLRNAQSIAAALLVAAAAIAPQSSFASSLTTYKKDLSWLPVLVNSQIPRKTAFKLDVERLRNYEVVLVIDKSQSMAVEDCPSATGADSNLSAPISRWEWCREQVLGMAQQANWVIPGRFRVVVFSGNYVTYENVDPTGVSMIFTESVPKGPTCVTPPLQMQLDQFFAHRNQSAKPLLIAMITDGCPNDAPAMRRAIAQATQKMAQPDDITIAILQVGRDSRCAENLRAFQNLASYNAKFNIVNAVPFDQLEKAGLVKTLANVVAGQGQEHISSISAADSKM